MPSKLLISLLVLWAPLALPRPAWAGECTCDNYREACRHLGACCNFGSQCGGSSSYTPSSSNLGQQVLERGASQLTSGFVNWLFSPSAPAGPSPQVLENQRLIQEQQLRQRQLQDQRIRAQQEEERRQAEERKRKFEERKKDVLDDWQGGAPSASADLPPQGSPASSKLDFNWDVERQKDFSEYHEGASERRKGLWKGDCWKNVPLPPKRPIHPIPDDEYQGMIARYQSRRRQWQDKCLGSSSPPPADETEPQKNPDSRAGGKTKLPSACADCLGVYNHEAGACESPASTDLFAYNDCLNRALGAYTRCSDPCNQ